MSEKIKAELKDLEQPVEEMTPDEAEQVEGGIIIVSGKQLMTNASTFSQISLNPQPLPPKTFGP